MAGIDYAVIAAYLLLMLGLGFLLTSKIRQFRDYFLAGGALTTPLLVCTLVSTYYELDVTFATSETAYYNGLVAWFWWSRPFYVCIFIAAIVIVRRLKGAGNFMSLPDVLEQSYGRGARVVGALACFVYCLPVAALGGLSSMFAMLGWNQAAGLVVAIGVCAIYTMMGGLWADAITDTVQFLLMCVSLAIAIPAALELVGGFGFTQHLPAGHMTTRGGVSWALILAWSAGALTVFVEPTFYQRIFAAKDSKAVMRSLLIGILLWASYDWAVTLIGMIARSAAETGVLPGDLEGRQALVAVCMKALPIGLKGLFIAGILAAAMSSVDSYSLLASSNIVYDIYRPIFKPGMSDKSLIRGVRFGIFLVMGLGAATSLLFARMADAWVFMSATLTSVVFVPVMGAIFLKPARAAGLAASAGGFAALVAFYALIYTQGQYDENQESWVWRVGGYEIWREYAVLFALPLSAAAFFVVNQVNRWTSRPG